MGAILQCRFKDGTALKLGESEMPAVQREKNLSSILLTFHFFLEGNGKDLKGIEEECNDME
jgi:hypothetical protein